ncbi:LPD29 domain-containing protein [Streptomyces erythrochromogenes]|uniref:LPD29 domain-containing protein n=1 Tax=Streptomyces erythrochromogenes TaxID=285574 RepID=UPI0034355AC0
MQHTTFRAADVNNNAYLDLRLTPGTTVTYHGSKTEAHGTYTVQPCACRHCAARVAVGRLSNRYALHSPTTNKRVLVHVRHTSVTPLPTEDELQEAGIFLPTKLVAVHLRRILREAFPATTFSVRIGNQRTDARYDITVRWSGGPSRTAVATATAHLKASYSTPGRYTARPVTVTTSGRHRSGRPVLNNLHLHHTV